MDERRRQKRHRKRLQVKYGEQDLSLTGFTTDVSVTGAFITAPRLPSLDTRVHLQIFTDAASHVYLEAQVRRHKVVPLNLRTVERGGFGVRFLAAHELLADVVGTRGGIYDVHYASKADLTKALLQEFRVGGLFVPTNRLVPQHTEVEVEIYLDFVDQRLTFEAKVVHVATTGMQGLGLVFASRQRVQSALAPFAEGGD
ncbi:MAG: PilZ domain-containing protein [Myxococcaceae bacterium]